MKKIALIALSTMILASGSAFAADQTGTAAAPKTTTHKEAAHHKAMHHKATHHKAAAHHKVKHHKTVSHKKTESTVTTH